MTDNGDCKGFGGADTHQPIDIEASPLTQAELAFTEDMLAIKKLVDADWILPWDEAKHSDYALLHQVLQRIVDLANHAGAHVMQIEGIRLDQAN